VRALEWNEIVGQFHTEHRIGPPSPAQALVREIDPETGEETSKRAIFDHQLRRLRIDDEGNVRRIRALAPKWRGRVHKRVTI
jgi:hypothetical protein